MEFWRLVELLNQRKWLIVVSVLVTVALTYAGTRLVGARWVATVRLIPAGGAPGMGRIPEDPTGSETSQQPDPGGLMAKAQAATYEQIVTGAPVLKPALSKMGLTEVPPDLLKNIKVEAPGARMFILEVFDVKPQRAQRLVNLLADSLVEQVGKIHNERVEGDVKLLTQQVELADRRLEATRHKADEYRKEHGIIGDLGQQMQRDLMHLDTMRQKREETAERLTSLQAKLRERQVELDALPATILVHHPIPMRNGSAAEGGPGVSPRMRELQQQVTQAEQEVTNLRKLYTDESPRVKEALARRNSAQADLDAEQAKIPSRATPQPASAPATNLVDDGTPEPNPALQPAKLAIADLKQEIAGARADLTSLDASIATKQEASTKYQGVDGPLTSILNDIAQQSESRSLLARQLAGAQMQLDASQTVKPLAIWARSGDFNPPINSTAGRTQRVLLIGALCALLGSAGLVVAFDSVDRRLRSVRQAETALPAPVRAAIPQPMGTVSAPALPRVTETQPLSLHSEAYRALGFHLLTSRARTVMVSSAHANQGCTNTVANLAITLAQAGHRVVVVDANVRAPRLHEVFEISNDFGFTSLLEGDGNGSLQEALHHTSLPNLWVIPSGPAPKNVWGLFQSARLMEVTNRLREVADYILYDTPSALAFTDALNLAPVVEAAYVCVRALQPSTGTEQRLIDALNEAHVMVLGTVLTDVPASVLETYSTYQRYYPDTAPSLPRAGTQVAGVSRGAATGSWIEEQDGEGGDNTL